MTAIRQAGSGQDQVMVRALFLEYLEWANQRLNQEYGIDFDIPSMVERDMADLEILFPPYGRLLLAFDGDRAVGIACMRRIREEMGEIKRMYVRPRYRGKGIGRALLDALLEEARAIGYPTVRLDSTRFMDAAHSLYRSAGFHEIEPYTESEIPPEFQHKWVFMGKQL